MIDKRETNLLASIGAGLIAVFIIAGTYMPNVIDDLSGALFAGVTILALDVAYRRLEDKFYKNLFFGLISVCSLAGASMGYFGDTVSALIVGGTFAIAKRLVSHPEDRKFNLYAVLVAGFASILVGFFVRDFIDDVGGALVASIAILVVEIFYREFEVVGRLLLIGGAVIVSLGIGLISRTATNSLGALDDIIGVLAVTGLLTVVKHTINNFLESPIKDGDVNAW